MTGYTPAEHAAQMVHAALEVVDGADRDLLRSIAADVAGDPDLVVALAVAAAVMVSVAARTARTDRDRVAGGLVSLVAGVLDQETGAL